MGHKSLKVKSGWHAFLSRFILGNNYLSIEPCQQLSSEKQLICFPGTVVEGTPRHTQLLAGFGTSRDMTITSVPIETDHTMTSSLL